MTLKHDFFVPHLKQTFTVSCDDFTVEMVLVETKAWPIRKAPEGVRTDPFALYFKFAGDPFPPQGTYLFANPATGEIPIFVVPVGREKDGILYEAIFN